ETRPAGFGARRPASRSPRRRWGRSPGWGLAAHGPPHHALRPGAAQPQAHRHIQAAEQPATHLATLPGAASINGPSLLPLARNGPSNDRLGWVAHYHFVHAGHTRMDIRP